MSGIARGLNDGFGRPGQAFFFQGESYRFENQSEQPVKLFFMRAV